MIPALDALTVKIFADGADLAQMLQLSRLPYIKGLTTNPTLMRKAGVTDYREFAREVLEQIADKPVSFEVLADDFAAMEEQAREISGWGGNVYVKIPVTDTGGKSSAALVRRLADEGVKLNVTALTTLAQVREIALALNPGVPSFVSIFAGRIADTGVDPVPIIAEALAVLRGNARAELMWASPRELLNIFQANALGCHVITVTADILKKLPLVGENLTAYSLATVQMFYDDAQAAGYRL
jgi:transaldolase